MILCDDSGWGSLLGGVMIGVYDTTIKKFYSKIIPIKYFQGGTFAKGLYRTQAVNIFTELLSKCNDRDYFTICRGTVLDSIYEMVADTYGESHVTREEIGEPLQSLLEASFAKHLKRCGVPQRTDGAHCLSFDNQLKWIYEDRERVKYVKTGWKSWKLKYE